MALMELIRARRSVRRFADRPVERRLIETCLEAARLAPSAENAQPWRFVVVDDPETRARLARAAFSGVYRATRFAARAPVIVAVLAKPDIVANRLGRAIQGTKYYLIDCGIACQQFVLQATELGLGVCYIGWYSKRGVRKTLQAPRSHDIVVLLAVGYPEGPSGKPKPRKDLYGLVSYNRFGARLPETAQPSPGQKQTEVEAKTG
jgi:nitroreductase